MKSRQSIIIWCGGIALLLLTGCAVPQHFWPQKDIAGSGGIAGPQGRMVLVASRGTEYKKQLVAELQRQLTVAQIPHKTIGIKGLEKIDTTNYAAVVVINTCLAWGLDSEVRTFIDNQKTTANIILLTTSGEGDWLPDKDGQEFDAMSGASVKTNINDVTRDLMGRIRSRLAVSTP